MATLGEILVNGLAQFKKAVRFLDTAAIPRYLEFKAPTNFTANYSLTLPASPPQAGQLVSSDANGVLAFIDPAVSIGVFRLSFTSANLTDGALTVPHNLGKLIVSAQVFDNNNRWILPDNATPTSTTALSIELASYGAIAGTWNVIVIG